MMGSQVDQLSWYHQYQSVADHCCPFTDTGSDASAQLHVSKDIRYLCQLLILYPSEITPPMICSIPRSRTVVQSKTVSPGGGS